MSMSGVDILPALMQSFKFIGSMGPSQSGSCKIVSALQRVWLVCLASAVSKYPFVQGFLDVAMLHFSPRCAGVLAR